MKDSVETDIVVEYIKDHLAAGQYKAAEGILTTRIEESIAAQEDAFDKALEKEKEDAKKNNEKVVSNPLDREFYAPKEFYHLLGVALDAQGKFEQAEEQYRWAIKRWNDGNPAVVMNNLALNLTYQGKLEDGMKMVSEAFVLSPDKPEIGHNLEMISALYKQGDE
jgi:tetratricopeptide (TPR) repeat protein